MQVDAAKLSNGVTFWAHDVWSLPFLIVAGTVQLYLYIGPSALAGVGSMALTLPLQQLCSQKLKKYTPRAPSPVSTWRSLPSFSSPYTLCRLRLASRLAGTTNG